MDMMDMQERLERVRAANRRASGAFNQTAVGLVDVFWSSLMALPEKSRDQIAPNWREAHARWMEHRTGTGE